MVHYAVSSHPQGTKDGYYRAVKKKYFIFITRGANYHWLNLITDDVLMWLINKLGLDKEYKYFKKNITRSFLINSFLKINNFPKKL